MRVTIDVRRRVGIPLMLDSDICFFGVDRDDGRRAQDMFILQVTSTPFRIPEMRRLHAQTVPHILRAGPAPALLRWSEGWYTRMPASACSTTLPSRLRTQHMLRIAAAESGPGGLCIIGPYGEFCPMPSATTMSSRRNGTGHATQLQNSAVRTFHAQPFSPVDDMYVPTHKQKRSVALDYRIRGAYVCAGTDPAMSQYLIRSAFCYLGQGGIVPGRIFAVLLTSD